MQKSTHPRSEQIGQAFCIRIKKPTTGKVGRMFSSQSEQLFPIDGASSSTTLTTIAQKSKSAEPELSDSACNSGFTPKSAEGQLLQTNKNPPHEQNGRFYLRPLLFAGNFCKEHLVPVVPTQGAEGLSFRFLLCVQAQDSSVTLVSGTDETMSFHGFRNKLNPDKNVESTRRGRITTQSASQTPRAGDLIPFPSVLSPASSSHLEN